MESLLIAEGLSVDLRIPDCEVSVEGCTGKGSMGLRVHECAFYYTCDHCFKSINKRIAHKFRRFERIICTKCGKDHDLATYYKVVAL